MTDLLINYSDPNKSPTPSIVLPYRASNSDLSIKLYGLGSVAYSKGLQQNLLQICENFSSDTPPVNATEGQLWYSPSKRSLHVARVNNPLTPEVLEWTTINKIEYGDTPPVYNPNIEIPVINTNALWYDTSVGFLKIHNGVDFVDVLENYAHRIGDTITGDLTISSLQTSGNVEIVNEAVFGSNDIAAIVTHTTPHITFPVGGKIHNGSNVSIEIEDINANLNITTEQSLIVNVGSSSDVTNTVSVVRDGQLIFSANKNTVSLNTSVDMHNNQIHNVSDPIMSSSLVPYKDVYALIQQLTAGYVRDEGSTMTGSLTVNRTLSVEGGSWSAYVSPDLTFTAADKDLRLINSSGGEFRIRKTAGDVLTFSHFNGTSSSTWLGIDLITGNVNAQSKRITNVITDPSPTMVINKQTCDDNINDFLATTESTLLKRGPRGIITFNASTGSLLFSRGCCTSVTKIAGSVNHFKITNNVPRGTDVCCLATNAVDLPLTEPLGGYHSGSTIKYVISCYQQSGGTDVIIKIYELQKQVSTANGNSRWRHVSVFPNVDITMILYY